MIDYVEDLRTTVTRVAERVRAVSDAEARRRPAAGKWSVKEIIGHLVDSAANNHARFVSAQFRDDLVFSGYAQAEWVEAQRYQDAPWPDLVTFWRDYNLHVARVMETIPAPIRIREQGKHNLHQIAFRPVAAQEPATLDYFMRDYVEHLHHHVRQVTALLDTQLT